MRPTENAPATSGGRSGRSYTEIQESTSSSTENKRNEILSELCVVDYQFFRYILNYTLSY